MNKKLGTGISIVVFLAIAVQLIIGTSFIVDPSITNTSTDQNLVCRWNLTGIITELNVSWYNGSNLYRINTVPNTSTNDVVDPFTHAKGEVWNCTVEVWNGTDLIQKSTTTTIRNAAPEPLIVYNSSAQDIGNQTTILEDTAYTFNVSSSDPDGDALYFDTSGPEPTGSSISSSGIFTWTPSHLQNGSNNVTFQATDYLEAQPKATLLKVNFIVQLVNDIPVFDNLADQNATQDSAFIYVITISDEEDNFPINFSFYSNNSNLILERNADNISANITFNNNPPVFADVGNWSAIINITDDDGGFATGSFTMQVSGINTPPNLTVGDSYNGTQGDALFIQINATDVDGDTLTFAVNDSNYNLVQVESNATNASAYINVTTNNTHIINRYINITVTDGSEISSQVVFINYTNVNDAPIIYNQSYYPSNTLGAINIYMYNLSAYASVPFSYRVNATDPDMLTYAGDNITFASNDSDFAINDTTGILNFSKNSSWAGNHLVLITATDANGTNVTAIMNISITNNTLPYFNESIGNQTCYEDTSCFIQVNGTDDDGDVITFIDNTTLFTIHNETGLINFTPDQNDIGTYWIRIRVTDEKGAYSDTEFQLDINNTNDVPVLDAITLPFFVENHPILYQVTASDEDLDLPLALQYDNLTFSSFNTTSGLVFTIQPDGWINFTPNSSHIGSHSINISVNDSLDAQDSIVINFEVYVESFPPNITQIYPYGTPVNNNTIVYSWYNATAFPGNTTTLSNLSENVTILFNHTTTDDLTALENISYVWLLDNATVNISELTADNHTYNHTFDFFSGGTRNVTLWVFDDMYENSSFTWLVNITNINRPPILVNQPSNVTADQTTSFNDYFSFYDSETKIIDPDDDLNGNQKIDLTETNTLTYTISSCSQATLSIEGADSLKVVPLQIGQCYAVVNATDGTYSVQSETILINVTNVPDQTEVPVSSGGGGSDTQTVTIPIPEEVEVPLPLEILIPSAITIYEDQTIVIPIKLQNNWNEALQGISLYAQYNVSNVTSEFGEDFFAVIDSAASVNTTLTITDYRLGENFEIAILANVTDPKSNDSATILINSIEQTSKGKSTQIKVVYAQDLLDDNPECQELNEVLTQALKNMEDRDYIQAEKLVDATIQGCKYLVEKQIAKNEESPSQWKSFFLFGNEIPTLVAIGIGVIVLALIITGIFARPKKQVKKSTEGKKIKY